MAFGILQNIPVSIVLTRARDTVKRVSVRVDRVGTYVCMYSLYQGTPLVISGYSASIVNTFDKRHT